MDWETARVEFGNPSAILKDGQKVIAKIYLSPAQNILRIVLPELTDQGQVTFKPNGIIDFRRKA